MGPPLALDSDDQTVAEYDMGWYEQEAMRAVESILSPLDWHRDAIKQHPAMTKDACLAGY